MTGNLVTKNSLTPDVRNLASTLGNASGFRPAKNFPDRRADARPDVAAAQVCRGATLKGPDLRFAA